MLDTQIEKALNHQINTELSAAYNYLAMGAYFEAANLSGFGAWMLTQHREELTHAMKLFHYILARGGKVELEAVEKPATNFVTTKDAFVRALNMERSNTESIYHLYKLAVEIGDYATQSHLQWFLDEQVEEERLFDEARALLDIAGDDKSALLMLNEKFGGRAGAGGTEKKLGPQ